MMSRFGIISALCVLFLALSPADVGDVVSAGTTGKGSKGKICITFDDLPVVRVYDRTERLRITDQILNALDEFGAKAAGFVVGSSIEKDIDILYSWREAGHILGNHTYSHPDINEVPAALYIGDIEKGHEAIEKVVAETGQTRRYFRYPFLHYGHTYNVKESVADYLAREGYVIAHVSIDTDDFVYNLQFEKIYQAAGSIEYVQLGNEYIDHILEQLRGAEELADELFGRPVKHILLLHANRLNGSFLGDLLAAISAQGYDFISLDDALGDPAYRVQESYIGPKGISYLERLEQTDPDLLPAREQR